MIAYSLPLLAPLILIACALHLHRGPKAAPYERAQLSEYGMLAALGVAVLSTVVLILNGAGTSVLIGVAGVGLSTRVDVLSMVMLLLVSFIGWVVVRYSKTYLDAEPRQTEFVSSLLATIAAVMLLVQAGNLHDVESANNV